MVGNFAPAKLAIKTYKEHPYPGKRAFVKSIFPVIGSETRVFLSPSISVCACDLSTGTYDMTTHFGTGIVEVRTTQWSTVKVRGEYRTFPCTSTFTKFRRHSVTTVPVSPCRSRWPAGRTDSGKRRGSEVLPCNKSKQQAKQEKRRA